MCFMVAPSTEDNNIARVQFQFRVFSLWLFVVKVAGLRNQDSIIALSTPVRPFFPYLFEKLRFTLSLFYLLLLFEALLTQGFPFFWQRAFRLGLRVELWTGVVRYHAIFISGSQLFCRMIYCIQLSGKVARNP